MARISDSRARPGRDVERDSATASWPRATSISSGSGTAPDRFVVLLEGVARPVQLVDLVHLALELIGGQGPLLIEPAEASRLVVLVGQASFERLHARS